MSTPEFDKDSKSNGPLTQKPIINSTKHPLPKGTVINKPNSDCSPAGRK
jgi:hypothetical protein